MVVHMDQIFEKTIILSSCKLYICLIVQCIVLPVLLFAVIFQKTFVRGTEGAMPLKFRLILSCFLPVFVTNILFVSSKGISQTKLLDMFYLFIVSLNT